MGRGRPKRAAERRRAGTQPALDPGAEISRLRRELEEAQALLKQVELGGSDAGQLVLAKRLASLEEERQVARGHAVAFLPDLMWYDQTPRFHVQQLAETHVRLIVTTCRAGSETTPAIVAVRQALRTAYQQLGARPAGRTGDTADRGEREPDPLPQST